MSKLCFEQEKDNWGQPVWKEGSRRDVNEADEGFCSLLCCHQSRMMSSCLGCQACMLQTSFVFTLQSRGYRWRADPRPHSKKELSQGSPRSLEDASPSVFSQGKEGILQAARLSSVRSTDQAPAFNCLCPGLQPLHLWPELPAGAVSRVRAPPSNNNDQVNLSAL